MSTIRPVGETPVVGAAVGHTAREQPANQGGEQNTNKLFGSTPFLMTLQVVNKKGILAKITTLISNRGIGIESLNFNSSNKGNVSILSLRLRGQRGQVQGLMNDARKVTEVKDIALTAV